MSLLSTVNRASQVAVAASFVILAGGAFGQGITLGSPGVSTLYTAAGTGNNQFVGIAASPNLVVFTRPFCQVGNVPGSRTVMQLNSNGTVSLYGTLPDIHYDGTVNTCYENYLSISPSSSNGWTIGDVYVATANPTDKTAIDVYKFAAAAGHARTLFGTYPGMNPLGHAGLGFDNQGPWNDNMILGGSSQILVISSSGAIVSTITSPTGDPNNVFESLRVAPAGFDGGSHSGWIFGVTDNVSSGVGTGVWAFGPPLCGSAGNPACMAINAISGNTSPQGESINFVPPSLCGFAVNNVPYGYFISNYDATNHASSDESTNPSSIDAVTTAALQAIPLPANGMLIQDESDGLINLFLTSTTAPTTFFHYPSPFVDAEDSTIVACPAPPPPAGGCPATQGFWHTACRWPAVNATVDGITYNGATDFSMVIGGIKYTQTELLQVMPSNPLHSGNYANSLSQLIAAVLNLASGAQHTPAVDAAVANANGALTGNQIFCGATFNTLCSGAFQTTVQSDLVALDNYNSAVGLNCSEATGLTVGSCHK